MMKIERAENIPDIISSKTIPNPPSKSSNFFMGNGFKMSKNLKRIKERTMSFHLKGKNMLAYRYPTISSMTTQDGSRALYIFLADSAIRMEKIEKRSKKVREKGNGCFLRR